MTWTTRIRKIHRIQLKTYQIRRRDLEQQPMLLRVKSQTLQQYYPPNRQTHELYLNRRFGLHSVHPKSNISRVLRRLSN